jgi:hypothetical protein
MIGPRVRPSAMAALIAAGVTLRTKATSVALNGSWGQRMGRSRAKARMRLTRRAIGRLMGRQWWHTRAMSWR